MRDPYCPLGKQPCRHCSDETKVIVQRVGVVKTGTLEKRTTVVRMGTFCNNDGRHFVHDLAECPMSAALAAPLVKHEITELEWMAARLKRGD